MHMAIYVYKHLRIYSSTDPDDRYSNLFLNAYINRHAHTEYLKMIGVYSPFGIRHVFCLRRSRRKHLCWNSDTLYLAVYLYKILLA